MSFLETWLEMITKWIRITPVNNVYKIGCCCPDNEVLERHSARGIHSVTLEASWKSCNIENVSRSGVKVASMRV